MNKGDVACGSIAWRFRLYGAFAYKPRYYFISQSVSQNQRQEGGPSRLLSSRKPVARRTKKARQEREVKEKEEAIEALYRTWET